MQRFISLFKPHANNLKILCTYPEFGHSAKRYEITPFLQGASKHWWNFRHFLHHAKPNIIKKDPDVRVANLFLLGDVLPRIFGMKKKGFMPHQFQHIYFVICKYMYMYMDIYLNSLPHDKFLDWSNLKAFADDKINVN